MHGVVKRGTQSSESEAMQVRENNKGTEWVRCQAGVC